MNAVTIKDVETISGSKAPTLRIWERRYNFLKPHWTSINFRYYGKDELKEILNIAFLNKFGFGGAKAITWGPMFRCKMRSIT